jgi:zinc protease
LQLAGEILKQATLPESEFEEIRKEQLTQLDFGKTEPQSLAFTEISRTIHPYPKGDVRATMSIPEEIEEVKSLKLEDAKAFYKRFYGASNGQLAVVGDFDPADVKKEIETQFGDWKSPAHFERVKYGFQKIAPVNQSIETPDKQNAVFIAATRLQISDKDPDYPALVMGNYMLGGGFLNSRLATRIRVKDGLSYGVGSSLSAKSEEQDGQFQVFAIAAPQNVAKVEAAFKEEMQRALADGFTQKELDDDRTGWLQGQQVNRSEDNSLVRTLMSRDYDGRTMVWDEELEKKVSALTPDDIGKAVRHNIDLTQMSIVKAGDFKKAAAGK